VSSSALAAAAGQDIRFHFFLAEKKEWRCCDFLCWKGFWTCCPL